MHARLLRHRSLILAVPLIVAAASCASTRPSGPAVDDAVAARPEALIQMRSDGCDDGSCPVYGVSIYADGAVVYRGGANVALMGQRKLKIPEASVSDLVATLEKMDFIDTPEHCCDCPDGPRDRRAATLVVDYRPGGVEKEILVNDRCGSVPDVMRGLTGQITTETTVAALIAPTHTAGKSSTRVASAPSPLPVAR
ncbi:MAG TPA: DUF6438 domain-containing protein [Polyangia bacterium]|jgi:hypothetical protein|nr:DUF6438 domain-containing protein [Polyangia bacterium]